MYDGEENNVKTIDAKSLWKKMVKKKLHICHYFEMTSWKWKEVTKRQLNYNIQTVTQ